MKTASALGIFWDDAEQVDGILAYGLWVPRLGREPEFPSGIWPAETGYRGTRLRDVDHARWEVLLWSIRVRRWPSPSEWFPTLRLTLAAMADGGAIVAWCAIDEYFTEPCELFRSGKSYVWAVYSRDAGFACQAPLDQHFATLDSETLERVQHRVNAADL